MTSQTGTKEARRAALRRHPQTFALPLARFGETLVGIQPARGYNIDPKDTYHSPDLVPPHGYLAFYAYLRVVYGARPFIPLRGILRFLHLSPNRFHAWRRRQRA